MGTRADFYIGCGKKAEWLGSVALDGYYWKQYPNNKIMKAKTKESFRKAVIKMFAERDDATTPDMGWPWPWDTSALTDYIYYFNRGKTKAITTNKNQKWPDMKKIKNVA